MPVTGSMAATGSPRLVPMARAEDAFLAYVRKPATQGMPSFVVRYREGDLRDVSCAHPRDPAGRAECRQSVPFAQG